MQRLAPRIRVITLCLTLILAGLFVSVLLMGHGGRPAGWFRLAAVVLLFAGLFPYLLAFAGLMQGTQPWWRPVGVILALLFTGTILAPSVLPEAWAPAANAVLAGAFTLASWSSFEYLARRSPPAHP